jgi:peptidoglycan/LPS O-acetylase OafA/YrhL
MAASHRLGALDALRGFAALWVVLHHFASGHHMPALPQALPAGLVTAVFTLGDRGVAVFFVLSGVVMALTAQTVRFDRVNAARFVWRRLVRLWPPYAVAVLLGTVVLGTKVALHEADAHLPSPSDVAWHLVFLQDMAGVPPISGVFWTLCLEVQFYIVFALTQWLVDPADDDPARRQRRRLWVWCAWGAVALLWTAGLQLAPLWRGSFLTFWYSFVAGVMCGLAWIQPGRTVVVATAYAALITLAGAMLDETYAITAGLTGLFVMALRRWPALQSALAGSALARLGLISYSLYLFHNPVTSISMRLFHKAFGGGLVVDGLALIVALAACAAASVLLYRGVEKAAIGWSRRIVFRGNERPAVVAAT